MAVRKSKKKQEEEQLVAPDPFLQRSQSAATWVEKNARLLLAGLVAFLVAVFVVQIVGAQSSRAASKVTTQFSKAVDLYRDATNLQTVLTSTSPEQLKRDFRAAYEAIVELRREHGEHPASRLAGLYQADLARRLGEHDEAVEEYSAYVEAVADGDPMIFMAYEGLGYSLEALGRLDDALSRYTDLARRAPYYRDYALKHQARVMMEKGDGEGARKAYQTLVDMEPATPLQGFATARLRALPEAP